MSFRFVVREGMQSMQRARLSSLLSVFAITLASLLLSSFALLFYNIYLASEKWQQQISFEVFLLDSIDKNQKDQIKDQIGKFNPEASILYIDKAEAAKTFKQLFNEDAISLLGYNPLPVSFRVQLNSRNTDYQKFENFVTSLENKSGVLTIDFARKQFSSLKKYISYFYYISGILGALIAVVALILIYNTVKLSIHARRHIIQTMRLVGATENMIRWPFVIQGSIEGTIGGLFSIGLLWFILEVIRIYTDLPVIFHIRWFVLVLFISLLFGVLGSRLAIRKYLPKGLEF